MIKRVDGNQLIAENLTTLWYGQGLKRVLKDYCFHKIEAGMVMVARFSRDIFYLFEIGDTFETEDLKETTFMYPIYGTRLPLRELPSSVTPDMIKAKTTIFRDCRLPTALEYDRYLNSITV